MARVVSDTPERRESALFREERMTKPESQNTGMETM